MRIVYSILALSLIIIICSCTYSERSSEENIHNIENEIDQAFNPKIIQYQKGNVIIETGNNNVAQQDVFKDKVVWSGGNQTEINSGSIHLLRGIYLYNTSDKSIKKIAASRQKGQTDETQINNDWICWTDWNDPLGKDWTIYAYSIASEKIIEIDSAQNHILGESSDLPRLSLATNNGYLVWTIDELNEQHRKIRRIYLSLIGKGRITKIAETNHYQAIPVVSNNYVVWNDEKEIILYSINEKKITAGISTSSPANYPKVSDDYVTWQEGNNLFIRSINKQNKEIVFKGEVFFYGIGINNVVWQSGSNIYSYNINTKRIMKLNDTEAMLPYIRNDDVIWQEKVGNKMILKLVTLNE